MYAQQQIAQAHSAELRRQADAYRLARAAKTTRRGSEAAAGTAAADLRSRWTKAA